MTRDTLPTFDDLVVARRRIAPHVHRTPVAHSDALDAELGATLFFKCENLQKVGAFKARGATNAVMSLAEREAARGVITHSSGNHGAALAYAAAARGIPCVVVMPDDAPRVKIEAVRGYGAEIVFCSRDERDAVCERERDRRGSRLVHPFEDPLVIAGQGTAALELLEQVAGLDLVVAPIGGGGLLSGTALAVGGSATGTRVVGAEPEVVDDAERSLRTGVRQPMVQGARSWGDGLMTGIGERAFAILGAASVRVWTVGERAMLDETWTLMRRLKLVVEPSAAVGLAALRGHLDTIAGCRVGVILSGGNTDFGWLSEL